MSWLKKLVEQYKDKDEIVDIFGVILYTDKHANIKKVLRDQDYWDSFHERSGPHWMIFSIRPRPGRMEYPINEEIVGPPGAPPPPPRLYNMVPVWKEPKENFSLLQEFGIESTKHLPQLLVFTESARGEILKHSLRLKDSSVNEAYASIKEAIDLVTRAIAGISPENRKNSLGAFQAVDLAVSDYKGWKRLEKAFDFYRWVKGLMP